MGLFDKLVGKKQQQETLDQGLQKTREGFLGKISKAIAGKSTVDEEVLDNLENALVRIKNGTYGICSVTGKLIPKERLIAVPHTTQSIEAKMMQHV